MKIIKIQKQHIEKTALTLTESFAEDPIFKYIFGSKEEYFKNAPWMFSTWIRWSVNFGSAWMTDDGNSVILLRAPGNAKMNLLSMIRSGMLLTPFKLGLPAFRRFYFHIVPTLEKKHKEILGDIPHWYGWMVGTTSTHKGQTRQLLNFCSNLADQMNLPVYLETASSRNVKLYQLKNFTLKEKIYLYSADLNLYFMVREPRLNRLTNFVI